MTMHHQHNDNRPARRRVDPRLYAIGVLCLAAAVYALVSNSWSFAIGFAAGVLASYLAISYNRSRTRTRSTQ